MDSTLAARAFHRRFDVPLPSKQIDGSFVFFGSKVDLKPRSVVDHRLTQITHGMLFIRGGVVLTAKFAYARHERYIRPVYLKKSSPMLVQHGLKVCNILVSDVKMDHNANSVIGEVKHVNALGSNFATTSAADSVVSA